MSANLARGVLTGSIDSGASVLYATLGEVIVERAGIVNLGVEGVMLMGASVAFATAAETGSPALAVLAGGAAAACFNLVMGLLVVTRGANQLASGLALMFFGMGLSSLIGKNYVGRAVNGLTPVSIPGLSDIPFLGTVLFRHDVLVYCLVPISLLVWWGLYRTRWGLGLRAVGENRTAAFAAGLRPGLIQYQALFVGGFLGGMGGAQLSIAYAGTWQEGMTVGRGFIAVALVIFSLWHPLRAVAGALLFGAALALQLQLQARGANVSPFILDMMPYLLTLAVVWIWGRRSRHAVPEGLKEVFETTS